MKTFTLLSLKVDMSSIKTIAFPGSNKMKKKLTRINTENTEFLGVLRGEFFFFFALINGVCSFSKVMIVKCMSGAVQIKQNMSL